MLRQLQLLISTLRESEFPFESGLRRHGLSA
jgi:hypothetical protein